MTFLFILCLVFSFVLLWLSSYSTNDTLQLIFFISAGLLMFIGGFGLLRLRHKTAASNTSHDSLREALAAQEREIARLEEQRKTLRFSSAYEEADADRRLADLKRRHAETVAGYNRLKASCPQKTEKLLPIIGIVLCLLTIPLSYAKGPSVVQSAIHSENVTTYLQHRTLDDLKGKVKRVFDQTNPGSYSFRYDDDKAVLDVWSDDTRRSVVEKAVTDRSRLEWWDENLVHLSATCDEVQKWYDDGGHPEITVVINLVNYYNHAEIFACASRGQIIYDAVADAMKK